MRMSKYYLPTMKEKPKDAVIRSHELMLRAGLIIRVASGFYGFLPLGTRVLKKVEQVIREEIDRIGGLEFLFSSVVPRDFLEKSGRWTTFKDELFRISDSKKAEYGLAPTHEESFTHGVSQYVTSYKQLPLILYQITAKFRDEIRPRYGVMRCREFRMKDAYSFHTDQASLDEGYEKVSGAYRRIFSRLGLDFKVVKADSGVMGGDSSQEFMVMSDVGEGTIAYCNACGYAANVEKADEKLEREEIAGDKAQMEKIHTPDVKSIEALSAFTGTTPKGLIKALAYKTLGKEKRMVLFFLRGDHEINDVKLQNFLQGEDFEKASEEELKQMGLVPGFIGPVNIPQAVECYLDETVDENASYVVGGGERDVHYKNFCFDRDAQHLKRVNVYQVSEESQCINGCGALSLSKVIEVGHIFKLGSKYSEVFNWSVAVEKGENVYPLMGCYGIGVDRLLAAVIEQQLDDKGIVWTKETAPFHVSVLCLNVNNPSVLAAAESLYESLGKQGYEVLLDDTEHRVGYKLSNHELIGIPLQIIVGEKGLSEGKVELRIRKNLLTREVLLKEVEAVLKQAFEELR